MSYGVNVQCVINKSFEKRNNILLIQHNFRYLFKTPNNSNYAF